MAQSYTRQSSFADGDTITAALFNNEYNQLVNAFSYSSTNEATTGHRHDGSAGEGGNIPQIGDLDFLNKIVVDSTNNRWGFYVQVASSAVEQLRLQDGALIPVTDSDVDLGTSSLYFKDAYIDSVTTTGNVSIGGNLTVTGNATISGNLTFGDADTDSINLAAEIDSHIVPNTDDTYDLGTSTKQWRNLYIDGTAEIDTLAINGTTVTSTAAELNILDGVTSTAAELNILDGVTSTTAELNILDGVTATAAEINLLDGVTATTAELNILDGVTSTAAELNILDGKAFLDEDNMASNSATGIASQQSIKAYVDSQVTAQDLDITTDSGTIAIDLDSETLTVTGGTGLASSATGNAVTLDIDSTVATLTGSQTLTNKTIDVDSNTVTNIEVDNLKSGVLDTDLTSVAATDTTLASAKAIKTYVDSQVTAQDLDFQGDTGGALSIDLDSESLTIAGGTGLDTVGSGNTVTVNIDSTVATLTGTQTLTNKTLTSPDINTPDIDGGTIDSTVIGGATPAAGTFTTLTANTSITGTLATAAQPNITSVGTLTGLTTTGDINLGDSDKAIFGAGSDLQIYHDGSNSYIAENGTGDLYVKATQLVLSDSAGANYIVANSGGTVNLYHNANVKLSTTSTGIDVTGTVTADGITNAGGFSTITGSTGTSNQASINSGTTTGENLYVANTHKYLNGAGTEQMRITGTSVGIGTSSPNEQLHISNAAPAVIRLERNDTTISSGNTIGNIEFEHQESGGEGLCANFAVKADTGAGAGAFVFETGAAGTLTEKVRFTSSGNVGIGTTSPGYPLDVAGNARANALVFRADGSAPSGDASVFRPAAGAFAIATNSTEKVRVVSNGNVGIGTTSPYAELSIKSASPQVYLETASNGNVQINFNENADQLDVMVNNSSGKIAFGTNSTERMRIDSSGNVGIGESNPTEKLSLGKGISYNADSALFTTIGVNDGAVNNNAVYRWRTGITGNATGHSLTFSTLGRTESSYTERLRIDASGNLLVGATSPTGSEKFTVSGNTAGAYLARFYHDGNNSNRYGVVISCGADDASGTNYALAIDDGDGTRQGQITFSGGTTTYGTSSDYRLKENIEPLKNGLSKVLKLNPVEFTWKKNNTKCEGFIAHEVQEICKEAVSGEKDGEEMQGVDYGRITPLLVKAIQEQQAQIEALQSEINLLKGE